MAEPGTDEGREDAPPEEVRGALARSLGLPAALSIGRGTMVGAGIVVFPGLAAGRAGPAASLSFAIGGGIALLVALVVSELATAMPRSGGPYHFVARGLGAAHAALVGIAQWLGLVFASPFYVVGAGHYLGALAAAAGFGTALPTGVVGSVAAAALTALAVSGTRRAGALQKLMVAVLLALLLAFLGWGRLHAAGGSDAARADRAFAPHGLMPVLTTAALVFTSFLGFAQVAAVAGEVRRPDRNLPRAMVGSVLIVTALYVATMAVATALVPAGRLEAAGETALAEVGRHLAGETGAVLFFAGGALATISSANASILAASRALYALGGDRVVPAAVTRIGDGRGTPHVALLASGGPVALLALLGGVELLAQVASLLHLVLYALLCAALLALRRRADREYAPGFRAPGHPMVALAGGLTSLGLLAFMDLVPLLVGAGVLVVAALWQRGRPR